MSKERNMICQLYSRRKENIIKYTPKEEKKEKNEMLTQPKTQITCLRTDLTRICGFWVRDLSGQLYRVVLQVGFELDSPRTMLSHRHSKRKREIYPLPP